MLPSPLPPTITLDAPESGRTLIAEFPDPIPGIIPFGTLTLFAGAPGVGKTAMLAEWCRRWRDGLTICGKPTNAPTGFYYLAADRQWKSHQLWFDAVGFSDIPHYSLADDRTLDLSILAKSFEAHKLFLSAVAALAPIPGSHLFVDPVSPLFIGGDPNRARDVATALLRISRVCQTLQINITMTAHFGKQKADPKELYMRPQDRIAGSGAFAGFTDTQVYLIDPVPPKQPYHILGWVPRHGPGQVFNYVRNTEGLFVPYKDTQEDELYSRVPEPEPPADPLIVALATVPTIPTPVSIVLHKIQLALSISHATAERYLAQLVKEEKVLKLRRGLYQRLA